MTSLHDVPTGEIWTSEAIAELKSLIESYGMRWSVVESLPVGEAVKYAGPERDKLIENYRASLANLGKNGIKTVCYNFMPVIDWIRTDIFHPMEDGSFSLYFDMAEFAYFDIHILQRQGAEDAYPQSVLDRVSSLAGKMTEEKRRSLIDTIIVKTQGFIGGNIRDGESEPLNHFKKLLSNYAGLSRDDLRDNLRYFLNAVMPVCEEYGIDMCIHPDDPPMPVLGLPRIASSEDDIDWILKCVDTPHNALAFCAGSLSASASNDVVAMARRFAGRTRFVHLRSCNILPSGDFVEAPHTAGRVNLVELCRIFEKSNPALPMRVDHGRAILGDERENYHPGYSLHGRMLAFGQVEGMLAAVKDEIKKGII